MKEATLTPTPIEKAPSPGREWANLYRVAGIAALVAGLIFRRNLGVEVSLFTGADAIPQAAADWYGLLQTQPLLGLSFLAVFDLVNYALVGVIFLALGAALWHAHRSAAALALTGGLVGITVSLASNISLTMLSLSQQWGAATSEAHRAALLAAGETLLATNDLSTGFPGTGPYVSLLLIALASLLFAALLLPSHRGTAIVGLLASGCDLAFCLTFPFAPALQALWMAAGGLFYMLWHLLLARLLLRWARS